MGGPLARVISLAFAFAMFPAAPAGAEVLSHEMVPIDSVVSGASCLSEDVHVTGQANVFFTVTSAGDLQHSSQHFNHAGVSGSGVTTGTRYVFPSTLTTSAVAIPGGLVFTFVATDRVIGVGVETNLVMTVVFVTVQTSQGTATSVERISIECR